MKSLLIQSAEQISTTPTTIMNLQLKETDLESEFLHEIKRKASAVYPVQFSSAACEAKVSMCVCVYGPSACMTPGSLSQSINPRTEHQKPRCSPSAPRRYTFTAVPLLQQTPSQTWAAFRGKKKQISTEMYDKPSTHGAFRRSVIGCFLCLLSLLSKKRAVKQVASLVLHCCRFNHQTVDARGLWYQLAVGIKKYAPRWQKIFIYWIVWINLPRARLKKMRKQS